MRKALHCRAFFWLIGFGVGILPVISQPGLVYDARSNMVVDTGLTQPMKLSHHDCGGNTFDFCMQ